MTDEEIPEFRTSDMALVATLRYEGFDVQGTELEVGGICYWYFILTHSLNEVVEAFRDGTLRVEPKEFNRLFGVTKKERFALTDPLHAAG